jgi:hypothetical protein
MQGQGTVTPNLNGAALTIGQVYTLSAVPAAGYTFSGWSQNYQQMSGSPTISFVMSSNLVLAANFVADPLVAAAGTYNGLFYQADEVRLAAAGSHSVCGPTPQAISPRGCRSGTRGINSPASWTPICRRRARSRGGMALRSRCKSPSGRTRRRDRFLARSAMGCGRRVLSGGRSPASSPYSGEYTVVIPGTCGQRRVSLRGTATRRCTWRRMVWAR